MATTPAFKDVVVVGGSYVGMMQAQELISTLPEGHRVLVIEKKSHFNHLFAFPRYALTSAGDKTHACFIPTTLVAPHQILHGAVETVTKNSLVLDRTVELDGKSVKELPFEALVVATGTRLTPPGTLPGETKLEGIAFLKTHQDAVKKANNIVIIGGGAVGVQMATDIPLLFPSEPKKKVTVVHSRQHLMPRFHPALHEIVAKRFDELGVKAILGSRAKVPAGGWESVWNGGVVELENGEKVEGDLIIFATGQTPNSDLLKSVAPSAIQSNGFISVKPTFQIDAKEEGLERIFAVGDIADSGAPKAARPAMAQVPIISSNIISLISDSKEELKTYTPDPAAIHLTLGLKESIIFRNPKSSSRDDPTGTFIGEPTFFMKDDGKEDMGIEGVWARRAPGVTDYHL
ncbi:hypothetical protein MNV49_007571 [Pseudohyphozyma bogoriensis]|nr:hypothetical protein MNV49_007571 [Pseudohyphozyma bogoriensis]